MAFCIPQTRRRAPTRSERYEISVADFKSGAAEGLTFWIGLILGLAAGLALGYAGLHGLLKPLW